MSQQTRVVLKTRLNNYLTRDTQNMLTVTPHRANAIEFNIQIINGPQLYNGSMIILHCNHGYVNFYASTGRGQLINTPSTNPLVSDEVLTILMVQTAKYKITIKL